MLLAVHRLFCTIYIVGGSSSTFLTCKCPSLYVVSHKYIVKKGIAFIIARAAKARLLLYYSSCNKSVGIEISGVDFQQADAEVKNFEISFLISQRESSTFLIESKRKGPTLEKRKWTFQTLSPVMALH